MSDQEEVIIERIVEEHRQGGHVTGPVAGCAICASQVHAAAATAAAGGMTGSVEELARARLSLVDGDVAANQVAGAAAAPSLAAMTAALPRELRDRLVQRRVVAGAEGADQPTLSDIALADGEGVLAALAQMQRMGLGNRQMPELGLALELGVGMLRAIVALEATIASRLDALLDVLEGDDELTMEEDASAARAEQARQMFAYDAARLAGTSPPQPGDIVDYPPSAATTFTDVPAIAEGKHAIVPVHDGLPEPPAA